MIRCITKLVYEFSPKLHVFSNFILFSAIAEFHLSSENGLLHNENDSKTIESSYCNIQKWLKSNVKMWL